MGSLDETGRISVGGALALLVILSLGTANVMITSAVREARRGGDSASMVFLIEAGKLSVALLWVMVAWRAVRAEAATLKGSALAGLAVRYSVPALLYVAMGNLLIAAVGELGPLNTVLMGQLKLPCTALCAMLMLGRRITGPQWGALAVLTVGAMLSQVDARLDLSSVTWLGALYMVGNSMLSAVSGVYTEVLLKQTALHLALQQLMLYTWSTCVSALSVVSQGGLHLPSPFTGLEAAQVACQIATGIMTGWLMRFQSNLVKIFLHTLFSLCVAATQYVLWGQQPRWQQGVALALIALSVIAFLRFEKRAPTGKK